MRIGNSKFGIAITLLPQDGIRMSGFIFGVAPFGGGVFIWWPKLFFKVTGMNSTLDPPKWFQLRVDE